VIKLTNKIRKTNYFLILMFHLAHQARVTSVYYSLEHDWVLSTSRDKYFAFHSTDNARRIGSYAINSWTTCLV
jgi:WD repeat and FYVE domain-containing protein 2